MNKPSLFIFFFVLFAVSIYSFDYRQELELSFETMATATYSYRESIGNPPQKIILLTLQKRNNDGTVLRYFGREREDLDGREIPKGKIIRQTIYNDSGCFLLLKSCEGMQAIKTNQSIPKSIVASDDIIWGKQYKKNDEDFYQITQKKANGFTTVYTILASKHFIVSTVVYEKTGKMIMKSKVEHYEFPDSIPDSLFAIPNNIPIFIANSEEELIRLEKKYYKRVIDNLIQQKNNINLLSSARFKKYSYLFFSKYGSLFFISVALLSYLLILILKKRNEKHVFWKK